MNAVGFLHVVQTPPLQEPSLTLAAIRAQAATLLAAGPISSDSQLADADAVLDLFGALSATVHEQKSLSAQVRMYVRENMASLKGSWTRPAGAVYDCIRVEFGRSSPKASKKAVALN